MYDAVNHEKFEKVWQRESTRLHEKVDPTSPWCASRLHFCIEVAEALIRVTDAVPDVQRLRVGTIGHMVFGCMLLHGVRVYAAARVQTRARHGPSIAYTSAKPCNGIV